MKYYIVKYTTADDGICVVWLMADTMEDAKEDVYASYREAKRIIMIKEV